MYPQRRWISKNCRREVERVAESEIGPNRHIFVSIVGREIGEKVPFNRSYWHPLRKSSTIAFRCNFVSSFFGVHVPDITSKLNNNKSTIRNKMSIKYFIFHKATPCNLLLWGCESWALRKSLLASIEVFLHRGIRRILKIRMIEVIKQHITNTSIKEKFYNIPTIKK